MQVTHNKINFKEKIKMFNKFAKVIRWSILLGMLYTLYVITIKDKMEFKNQTDEKTLVDIGQNGAKNKDRFLAYKKLCKLHPQKSEYKEKYTEVLKQQANGLLNAHEKMMLPLPVGNYRYIDKIEFGQDSEGKYVLIFNLTKIFQKQDKKTQDTLKQIFIVSHHGIYKHFGFDDDMRLLLVPTYDKKEDVGVIDLGRKYEEFIEVPNQPEKFKLK